MLIAPEETEPVLVPITTGLAKDPVADESWTLKVLLFV
jgi:hypothetical protein